MNCALSVGRVKWRAGERPQPKPVLLLCDTNCSSLGAADVLAVTNSHMQRQCVLAVCIGSANMARWSPETCQKTPRKTLSPIHESDLARVKHGSRFYRPREARTPDGLSRDSQTRGSWTKAFDRSKSPDSHRAILLHPPLKVLYASSVTHLGRMQAPRALIAVLSRVWRAEQTKHCLSQ